MSQAQVSQAKDLVGPGDQAGRLRAQLVDRLVADGKITSPAVEAAFRTVPREAFVPAGTALDVTYSVDNSLVTKTDEYGMNISSVSATYIQARMIEMAGIRAGMTVLEIGSGGYNAALLAEVVGPAGHVVSVDLDAEITDRARDLLDRTGYNAPVTVVRADAEHRVPGFERFDRTLVTVGAWDISPAWLDQLTPDGVLVVPLRMNGVTRTIAFGRRSDHLRSVGTEVAGFVPMQGAGAHPDRTFPLTDGFGGQVTLRFDAGVPETADQLDGAPATTPTSAWSGVTVGQGVSFADLHLWLATRLPGFCRVDAEPRTLLTARPDEKWFPYGCVRSDAFAGMTTRPAHEIEGGGAEFGAIAYGPHGQAAAAKLVDEIRAWDRHARHREPPAFAYWPAGSDHTQIPAHAAVLRKRHGAVSICWPEKS